MSVLNLKSLGLILSSPAILGSWTALAHGEELKAFVARSVALDTIRGAIYFMPGRNDDEVVATFDGHEGPLRIVAPLLPGQRLELSRLGDAGETPSLVEVRREGDKVLVTDRPRPAPTNASTSQEDFLSGP